MKKLIFLILLFCSVNVAGVTCPGKVTMIMDWPLNCNGNLAFKLDSSHDKWLCALSDKSNSLVLTAYAANKTIVPRIDTAISASCVSLDHYHTPLYIHIQD